MTSHAGTERMGCYLEALPGKATVEQEYERVCQGFQIISPSRYSAQMRMHASISDCSPAKARVSIGERNLSLSVLSLSCSVLKNPNLSSYAVYHIYGVSHTVVSALKSCADKTGCRRCSKIAVVSVKVTYLNSLGFWW